MGASQGCKGGGASLCVRRPPLASGSYVPVDSAEPDGEEPEEDEDIPDGLSEQDYLAQVGGSKAIAILQKREAHCVSVEGGSVYGAALVMPQVARSVGWELHFSVMAAQTYGWLLFNIFMQAYFLYLISTEQSIMNKFSGQMHLCDFGASTPNCPGASDCFGPAGTEYTPSRLYSYDLWSTRTFVRDSLNTLFPDRKEDIARDIDPGEYGLESYSCRVACIFIFILALWGDLSGTLDMVLILWHVPNEAEHWITYEVPDWSSSKAHMKAVQGWTELDFVHFRVRGMSVGWKLANVVSVIAPKIWLWFRMIHVGVTFLMETAAITDLIINAVALNFVLGLDELIFSILLPVSTKYVLEHLEQFESFDISDEEDDTMREAFDKHSSNREWTWTDIRFWDLFVSRKFIMVIMITITSITEYYMTHCVWDDKLGWVAKSLFLPETMILNVKAFLLPFVFPEIESHQLVWEMPDITSNN
eukprot:TRINITY_DN20118_c0_g1_i1.p1 TRINITY_DN20118_c0_g1~~TRINITY_DN20118_c0_g1_i1.p1  ORF type:complete len:474 (+),score=66.00 TRINITY_DN20118_c0_g1_i1:60-1481(+)